MQTRFLRERLQRCRGELSHIAGIARDLKQVEQENARLTATRPLWNESGRFGGRTEPFTAASTFERRETQAVAMLERIEQTADRCAATLSDIERDIDMVTDPEASFGYQSQGAWGRGPAYGSARNGAAWGTGSSTWASAGGSWASGGSTWASRDGGQGRMQPAFAASAGTRSHPRPTFGAAHGGSYATRRAYPRSTFHSAETNGYTARYANAQPRLSDGYGRYPAARTPSQTDGSALPTWQQGGYDYAYSAKTGLDRQSPFRGSWNGENRRTWEREPAYAAVPVGRY